MQEGIIAKAKGALNKRKEKKEKVKNAKERVLDAKDKIIDAKASFNKAKIALKLAKSESMDIKTEDGGDFVFAAAQAKKDGKKKFKFQGKEYPVTIKTDIEESTNSESAFKLLITALKRKGLPTPKISKSSFTIPETDIKVTVDENVIDIFNGGKNPIKSFWPPLKLTYKQAADYIEEVFFDESTDKNMKEEIEIPEDIKKEDGGDFVYAAAQAKKDGKKKFTFQGKEYPVTIKTDIDESIDGRTKLFKEKCKALGYGKGHNDKDMKEIEEELSKKLIGESSLDEAAGIAPMKELEQAWIRTDGDKVKQAKLIQKHNLLPVFSSVRPGSIKLGIMNKLNASKKPLTYAGLDDDEELVFLSNNPMKIWYPKKGQHRPKGDGIKGFIESTTVNPRLAKIIELATGETDKVLVEAFIRDHNITGNEKTSVIQKEYNKFLA